LRFVAPVVHDFEGKLAHESLLSFIWLFGRISTMV
jgi:hypothetical protein